MRLATWQSHSRDSNRAFEFVIRSLFRLSRGKRERVLSTDVNFSGSEASSSQRQQQSERRGKEGKREEAWDRTAGKDGRTRAAAEERERKRVIKVLLANELQPSIRETPALLVCSASQRETEKEGFALLAMSSHTHTRDARDTRGGCERCCFRDQDDARRVSCCETDV